jgi:L-lactate permease
LQAPLVGWLLALFFEGAAGFGTPVALAAPILVGLGIAPVQAVVLALLGHAAGLSFVALGTPLQVLRQPFCKVLRGDRRLEEMRGGGWECHGVQASRRAGLTGSE